MLINDKDAQRRLNSPINLINKLRNGSDKRNDAMKLFGVHRQAKPEAEKLPEKVTVEFNPFAARVESQTSLPSQLNTQLVPASTPASIPATETLKVDSIFKKPDAEIKLGLAHDNAMELLNMAVTAPAAKLDGVSADKLPAVISAAAKTVEGIRKERNEAAKNGKDREVHFHFYTPVQRKVSDYEIVDVTGTAEEANP